MMELSIDLSKPKEKLFTYADFLTWVDDIRRELVDGFVRMMGAPLRIHQEVSGNLYSSLRDIVKHSGGGCRVYSAPFEVCFPEGDEPDGEIKTVLQPDVCVVCDLSKLRRRGCRGAPDLVIEILSLSSLRHDVDTKFHIYERHGVREYWVVDPVACGVNVYILGADGKYDEGTSYEESGAVPVSIFGGASIELSSIFEY